LVQPLSEASGVASLGRAKVLGLLGSIFMLTGVLLGAFLVFVIGVFAVLVNLAVWLAGLILVYTALIEVSTATGDRGIRSHYAVSLAVRLPGVASITTALVLARGFWLSAIRPLLHSLRYSEPPATAEHSRLLVLALLLFVAGYVLEVVGTYYLRKSYILVRNRTGVDFFDIASLLYFIGAVLLIVLVGSVIQFIGLILEIAAWASLPEHFGAGAAS